MSEHFIKEIEIKEYKLFKDFKADGFGRVNLIGGKNNVGKTAFMEAIYINVHAKNINTLFTSIYGIKFRRDNLEFMCKDCSSYREIFEKIKFYSSKSNISVVNYELINENGKKEYSFDINDHKNIINANEFSYQFEIMDKIGFIDNFGLTIENLKDVYIAVQRKDKEEVLYKYINQFDNAIEKFKIMGGDSPECKIKAKDEYRPINEFGDGLKHYISIICSLYACADGYLFIDEIDNGIHYTQLDKLWEIILKLSKEQNVQVFATTHSKEMIESYARVAKKLEDEEIRFISLYKDNENIKAIVFNNQEIEERLELGLDNR
jgi:AAA15 family ATPase/GTPase